jgi:lauroyl/myristoyl acyltransferase
MKSQPIQLPQAPELGRARRWLGSLHVTGVFWYRFHRFGMRVLPSWAVTAFIVVFTSFFFVVLIRIRRAIASNLVPVLGPCGWWRRQRRIYRTLWNVAWCLSERYERLDARHRESAVVTAGGEEHWRRAMASPEGLILVTAHVGHWELGSMSVPGRHVHVVREEEMDREAQKLMRELLERQASAGDGGAGFTVHFARADPALGLKLLKALRRGEMVAVQGDRPPRSARTTTVRVFGRPLDLPSGPEGVARAAGVALLPVFVFRRGRHRSELVFRPPIRVAGPEPEALEDAIHRIGAEVEWAIRREPHQWFCFRELWPE